MQLRVMCIEANELAVGTGNRPLRLIRLAFAICSRLVDSNRGR